MIEYYLTWLGHQYLFFLERLANDDPFHTPWDFYDWLEVHQMIRQRQLAALTQATREKEPLRDE